jgi:hypothetical protein
LPGNEGRPGVAILHATLEIPNKVTIQLAPTRLCRGAAYLAVLLVVNLLTGVPQGAGAAPDEALVKRYRSAPKTAMWNGKEMLSWAADGAAYAYAPSSDSWRTLDAVRVSGQVRGAYTLRRGDGMFLVAYWVEDTRDGDRQIRSELRVDYLDPEHTRWRRLVAVTETQIMAHRRSDGVIGASRAHRHREITRS